MVRVRDDRKPDYSVFYEGTIAEGAARDIWMFYRLIDKIKIKILITGLSILCFTIGYGQGKGDIVQPYASIALSVSAAIFITMVDRVINRMID